MTALDPRPLLILGAGAYAEEIAALAGETGTFTPVGFVDEDPDRKARLLGLPVWPLEPLPGAARHALAVCAVGSTHRAEFIERATKLGVTFASVLHPASHISPTARIGDGCIAAPGVVVGAYASVDDHVILNRGVLVGHHARIGRCATLSPGANVGGKAHIGERAYVGMGAIVLNRLAVGPRAVVAAGAVVTHDVAERTQVVGAPARVTKEGIEGY